MVSAKAVSKVCLEAKLCPQKLSFVSRRQNVGSRELKFVSGQPKFVSERPEFVSGKPKMASGKLTFASGNSKVLNLLPGS